MTVRRTIAKSDPLFKHYLFICNRTLEELLLQFGLGDLNLDGLVNLLLVPALVVGIVLDGGGEQRVDECSFAEPRFASNLNLGDM